MIYKGRGMATLGFGPATPSQGNCFTTIYSKNASAPARMDDGRMFTDYRPRCAQYPIKLNSQWGEHDGRQNMIHGSDVLMEEARNVLQRKATPVSSSCVDTMVPELYKRVCTWRGCETIPGHFTGIGTGRIFLPDSANLAEEPDKLAQVTQPNIPNTYEMEGPNASSQCASDDKERLWSFLDTPSQHSARNMPYSGPRA